MQPTVSLQDVSLRLRLSGGRRMQSGAPGVSTAVGGRIERGHGSTHVVALDRVNMELFDGDRIALIGHNGAGKTTLLRLLAGVYVPSSGRCVVRGRRSCLLSVGMGLSGEASLVENIRLALALYGLKFSEINERIPHILEFAELTQFSEMPLHACSAGMRARLGFAIATNTSPDVFLVDEALAAGDARFAKKARARVDSLFEETRVLVLAAHSNRMLKRFCNKALWMEQGRVRELGECEEVLAHYAEYCAAEGKQKSQKRRRRKRRKAEQAASGGTA